MKHLRLIVLAFAVIAAGATACFKDPVSSLRNGPSRIELTRSSMFLNVGDSLPVQAVVKDAQGNTYDCGDAAWTSATPAVAVVHKDTTDIIPFNSYSSASVVAVAPGLSWVFVTTHGMTDSIQVYGLPLTFGGAVTITASPTIWDTLTIASAAPLTFNTTAGAASVVTVGGASTVLLTRSATQLRVLPPVGVAGPIAISNVMLLGIVQIPTLTATTAAPAVTDIGEPANDGKAGAVNFGAIPAAATAANPFVVQGYFTAADVNDYYTFTLAAPAAVNAVLAWYGDGSGSSGNPDLDVILCDATLPTCDYNLDGNDLFGFSASTAVQPQSGTTATLPAGTYVFHVYGYTTPATGAMYQLQLNLQ